MIRLYWCLISWEGGMGVPLDSRDKISGLPKLSKSPLTWATEIVFIGFDPRAHKKEQFAVETNIAPENWWLKDYVLFLKPFFQVRTASFRGGTESWNLNNSAVLDTIQQPKHLCLPNLRVTDFWSKVEILWKIWWILTSLVDRSVHPTNGGETSKAAKLPVEPLLVLLVDVLPEDHPKTIRLKWWKTDAGRTGPFTKYNFKLRMLRGALYESEG